MEDSIQLAGRGVLRTPEQAGSGALADLLDRVERQLSMASEDARTARMTLDELFLALQACRLGRTEPEWQRLVEQCRRHRVLSILHQDPFTKRAFEKPRGYAGDACMMDMIYAIEDRRPAPPATVTGRAVFDYVTRVPACEGVRSRRAIVAAFIDRLAGERARPHVLSIAAGHLREANLSVAIRRGRVGRVLALDSDAESLAEVRACYGQLGVETRAASFRTLIDQRRNAERFDLVYSTGLFDYVGPRTGRKLVTAMHRMLTPSGSLLVANFLPGVRDTGYMEAFMDWKLIYRSRQDLVDLTRDIPESEIKSLELWSEEALNVIFLKVTRH